MACHGALLNRGAHCTFVAAMVTAAHFSCRWSLDNIILVYVLAATHEAGVTMVRGQQGYGDPFKAAPQLFLGQNTWNWGRFRRRKKRATGRSKGDDKDIQKKNVVGGEEYIVEIAMAVSGSLSYPLKRK